MHACLAAATSGPSWAAFEHQVFPEFNKPTRLNINKKLTEMMIYSGVSCFFWEWIHYNTVPMSFQPWVKFTWTLKGWSSIITESKGQKWKTSIKRNVYESICLRPAPSKTLLYLVYVLKFYNFHFWGFPVMWGFWSAANIYYLRGFM